MKDLKGFFLLNLALLCFAWWTGVHYYPLLPDRIPSHFDLSGHADTWVQKSFITVYILPLIQTFLVGLLTLLTRFPQYSNIPSTIALEALEPDARSRIYEVIRKFLLSLSTCLSATLLYVQSEMMKAGLQTLPEIRPARLIVLFGALTAIIFVFVVWMIKTTREIVSEARARRGAF